jgi:hypothetical protein
MIISLVLSLCAYVLKKSLATGNDRNPTAGFGFGGRMSRRDINGYDWKVIVDPTRHAHDPGLFFGGLFRMVDLRLDRDEKSTWPDGIVFEHVHTSQRLTFDHGKLFDLTHQLFLARKPRHRIRKGKTLIQKIQPSKTTIKMRRFLLIREKDLTGVSGTGVVAEGIVFTDGLSVLHWLREPYATGMYRSLADVIDVHGHDGATQVEFIDAQDPGFIPEGDGLCPTK